MYNFMKLTTAIVFVGTLAACAQQEEPVTIIEDTPIYGKDGTIIGSRPAVSADGTSGGAYANGSDFDDDDDDGDDDG